MNEELKTQAQVMLMEAGHIVKRQQERARLLGENFNLFEILRIEHYEVSTHSRLIAELLDPQGRHGQGTLFLDAFLQVFAFQDKIESKSATVHVEHGIGVKSEVSGGRLDILIQDGKGRKIAIENKIYAADQENWVVRYSEALNAEDSLVYLTLLGTEIDGYREDDSGRIRVANDIEVHRRSYQNHILEWLNLCHQRAVSLPVIRETLVQYRDTVKKLTHQNSSSIMDKELVTLAKNDLDTYFKLARAEGSVKASLIEKLNVALKSAAASIGLETSSEFDLHVSKRTNFHSTAYFANPEMRSRNVQITFSFGNKDWVNLLFGFGYIDHKGSHAFAGPLHKALTEFGIDASPNDYWAAMATYPDPNWGDDQFKKLHTGELVNELIEKVAQLKELFDETDKITS